MSLLLDASMSLLQVANEICNVVSVDFNQTICVCLNLKTSDLKSVHIGVKFSCSFKLRDLEDRWHALLYNEKVSKYVISCVYINVNVIVSYSTLLLP